MKIYELHPLLTMKYAPATTVASSTTTAATSHFLHYSLYDYKIFND